MTETEFRQSLVGLPWYVRWVAPQKAALGVLSLCLAALLYLGGTTFLVLTGDVPLFVLALQVPGALLLLGNLVPAWLSARWHRRHPDVVIPTWWERQRQRKRAARQRADGTGPGRPGSLP